eukprot:147277-Chlamydomonas_euryale.AAC.1
MREGRAEANEQKGELVVRMLQACVSARARAIPLRARTPALPPHARTPTLPPEARAHPHSHQKRTHSHTPIRGARTPTLPPEARAYPHSHREHGHPLLARCRHPRPRPGRQRRRGPRRTCPAPRRRTLRSDSGSSSGGATYSSYRTRGPLDRTASAASAAAAACAAAAAPNDARRSNGVPASD